MVHVLQITQNLVISRFCFAKKCTKNYNARAQLLFCSLKLLFSDVAVAVMVFLNSLMLKLPNFFYVTRLQGIMVVVRSWMQLPWFLAGTSHYRTRLQRIIVIVFIKTNLQSKMMNITTMIPCRRITHSKLPIAVSYLPKWNFTAHIKVSL